MKNYKFSIFVLILILFSSIVFAGITYPIDFSKSNNYLVNLREGDRIEFDLNDERHTIIIRNININSVDLTCFLNLNTQNIPMYLTIGKTLKGNTKLKLDTNKDDIDDLYVWVDSINNGKVGIRIFEPINDNKVTGYSSLNSKNKPNYKWIIFPLMVVILLILIVGIRKKQRK